MNFNYFSLSDNINRKWQKSIFIFCVLFSICFIGISVWMISNPEETAIALQKTGSETISGSNPSVAVTKAGNNPSTDDIPENWIAGAEKSLQAAEYHINYQEKEKEYQSPNRANNLRVSYRPG